MDNNKEVQQQAEQFFTDNNEVDRSETTSPSGRFKLLIRSYSTKKGCWHYSRGTIYNLKGEEICDIKRNYSCFHHSFVVKDSKEWLIAGRSYMSQTIVNLDTGEVFEPSGDHYEEYAFCWAGESLSSDGNLLLVEGCYWAGPYEYKFFDFSDPSKGWPELEIEENGKSHHIYGTKARWNKDGTVTLSNASRFYLPLQKYENDIKEVHTYIKEFPGEYDKEENWRTEIDQKITLEHIGNKMIVTERWVSEVEKLRIEKRRLAIEKRKQWTSNFKATDLLYLEYLKLLKDPTLSPNSYESVGVTFKGWSEDFIGKETRWCRRLLSDNQSYTADLEWAVKTGPIKLVVFKEGSSEYDLFFPHSVAGMQEAFSHAKNLAKKNQSLESIPRCDNIEG